MRVQMQELSVAQGEDYGAVPALQVHASDVVETDGVAHAAFEQDL